MRKFILGLDEGTTSARSVLYDIEKNKIIDFEAKNFKQYYPKSGWVEQDAEEIYRVVLSVSRKVLKRNEIKKTELLGVGITNQRETVIAWDRDTGKPIYNAIVWQCRRTSNMIKNLPVQLKEKIKQKTGLIANPYFSASKMKWILDNVKEARFLAKKDQLCFGTVDSYLAFMLTGNHVTDTTNASRTMLMNIHTMKWDEELLEAFKIPASSLPEIKSCDAKFGNCKQLFNAPLCAILGDQQSSLVGQGCLETGNTKITYGTGCFILTNIGSSISIESDNLVTSVGYTLKNKTNYAIEGSIFSACSALNWLENSLELFDDVKKTATIANSLNDNEGVYFVPAFTGLGAPYWENDVRASLSGMSFNTTKAHIIRAILESMAYNTKAIFDILKEKGQRFKKILVDGGGSKNDFLMQFLADMLNHAINRSGTSEATSMGAIFTAMISLGLIETKDIKTLIKSGAIFTPQLQASLRNQYYDGWVKAVKKL